MLENSSPSHSDPMLDVEILTTGGKRFGWFDHLRAWLFDDRIRALLRRPGRPDRAFEALMPVMPQHLPAILAAAASRVAVSTAASSSHPPAPATIPPQPARFASPARRAITRILRGPQKWRVGQLLSNPFDSGTARVREVECAVPMEIADPFVLSKDGVDWLFAERISPAGLGELVAAPLLDGKVPRPGEPILDLPYHLSWPNVFEREGRIYMVPETGSAKEVSLWVCDEFPGKWSKVRTLLEGESFHDGTLLELHGRWWLFVSVGGSHHGDHSAELRIYHSDDLFGSPFVPHPQNPVSLSVEGGRPAGNFFTHEGCLYRPGQDGRDGYGKGVIVFRVDRLDETSYRETPVSRILPPKGASGIHTLNRMPGGGWIVDLRRLGNLVLAFLCLEIPRVMAGTLEAFA